MATAQRPPGNGSPPRAAANIAPHRSDRSRWHWLLLLGILVPLIVPVFNSRTPKFGGWPLFYWLQMAYIALGVAVTVVVYFATRRSREERAAAERAADSGARDGLVAPDEEV